MKHTTHNTQHTTRAALLTIVIAALAVPALAQNLVPPKPDWTPEVPENLTAPQVDPTEFTEALEAALAEHPHADLDEIRRVRAARDVDPLGLLAEAPETLEITCMAAAGPAADLEAAHTQARTDLEVRIEQAAALEWDKVPEQYIVTFADSAFPYAAVAPGSGQWKRVNARGETLNYRAHTIVAAAGGELASAWNRALAGFSARLSESSVAAVEALPEVASVVPDGIVRASTEQVINEQGLYGLDRIDEHNISSEDVYRYHSTGGPIFHPEDTGSHVYVLDTGLRSTHEEFNASGGTSVGNGAYFITNSLNDVDGHGTHVAGTIGGATYGVAKNVTIHPVKVLGDSGSGSWTAFIGGVNWVIDEHLANPGQRSVANMSLWGGEHTPADKAIENLVGSGVIAVTIAGNANSDANHYSPGRVPEGITVGAVNISDTIASYSNWGPRVDVWAPGGDASQGVLSAGVATNTATATLSGTSMAAPHVAGVAARYLQENPHLTPSQMMNVIRDSAVENKISGNLHGADNRLLHYETWWYPLHTNEEWMNSDVPYSTDHWFECSVFDTIMYTSYELRDINPDGDLPVYHLNGDKWLIYVNPNHLPAHYGNVWVFFDMKESHFTVVFPMDMHSPTGPMIVNFPWL